MKSVTAILVVSFLISFHACENNESVLEKWQNGQLKKTRITNKADEFESNYFQNGVKESEGLLIQNKKEGQWKYYHPNGSIKKKVIYKEGVLFGESFSFFENGQIKSKGFFDELSLRTGIWYEYFENGQMKTIGSYNLGAKTDEWSYFNNNGIIEKNESFDDKGNLSIVTNFGKEGKQIYHAEFYPYGGVRVEEINLNPGNDTLLYRKYFENGQLEREGNKIFSHEIGLWTFWYSNGQKKSEGLFSNDLSTRKNQNLEKLEQPLEKLNIASDFKGIKKGIWVYWDFKGDKIAKINY